MLIRHTASSKQSHARALAWPSNRFDTRRRTADDDDHRDGRANAIFYRCDTAGFLQPWGYPSELRATGFQSQFTINTHTHARSKR